MKCSILPLLLPGLAVAGPYPSDDSVEPSASMIWAASATIEPGPVDATAPDGATASYGSASDATGPSDAADDVTVGVVSLGDGGIATLKLASPVADGAGPDIAVYENGFDQAFLELAHVEVSSDGIHFVRFPSVSGTQTDHQIGGFTYNGIDPTDLHNLAGKYEAGLGTAFDLNELRGASPRLDVSHITHIRIIDVVGSINPTFGSTDSHGNFINDPFKTNFITGGFDLDAAGGLHAAPATSTSWLSMYFPSGGDTGDTADPDGDRIANLVEYATASDPTQPNPAPLKLSLSGESTFLSWTRAHGRSDVTLSLQGSDDLSNWTTLTAAVGAGSSTAQATGVAVTDSTFNSSVTASVPANYTFFRLKAER